MKNFEALRKDWESFQTGGGGGGSLSLNYLPLRCTLEGITTPEQPEVYLTPRDILNKIGQTAFDYAFCRSENFHIVDMFMGFEVRENSNVPGGTYDRFEQVVYGHGVLTSYVEPNYDTTPASFGAYILGDYSSPDLDTPFES